MIVGIQRVVEVSHAVVLYQQRVVTVRESGEPLGGHISRDMGTEAQQATIDVAMFAEILCKECFHLLIRVVQRMAYGAFASGLREVRGASSDLFHELLVGHKADTRYLHIVARNLLWVCYHPFVLPTFLVNLRYQPQCQREDAEPLQVDFRVSHHLLGQQFAKFFDDAVEFHSRQNVEPSAHVHTYHPYREQRQSDG